jgi:hypothetical protein
VPCDRDRRVFVVLQQLDFKIGRNEVGLPKKIRSTAREQSPR